MAATHTQWPDTQEYPRTAKAQLRYWVCGRENSEDQRALFCTASLADFRSRWDFFVCLVVFFFPSCLKRGKPAIPQIV